MEAKGLKDEQEGVVSQGPGPGSTTPVLDHPPCASGPHLHSSSDTDEEANKDDEQEEHPGENGEEVKFTDCLICMNVSQ